MNNVYNITVHEYVGKNPNGTVIPTGQIRPGMALTHKPELGEYLEVLPCRWPKHDGFGGVVRYIKNLYEQGDRRIDINVYIELTR